jgi:mono/diheme cytochrome c family protein
MIRTPVLLLFCATLPVVSQSLAKPARTLDGLRAFYAENCTRCHGADGSAQGADGKRLKGADFTDTKALEKVKDDSLANTILKGKFFGLGMPAYKDQLSLEETRVMVAQVLRKAEKGKAIGSQSPAK